MVQSKIFERKTIWCSIAFAIVCLTIHCLTKKLYSDVDNFTISVVTNGLYDANNYCLYLHPVLCWIIAGISCIFPNADAFVFIGRILIFLELAWLFYMIIKSQQRNSDKILGCLLVLFLSTALSIWNENYTVQAAVFMTTGSITLCSGLRVKEFKRLNICIGTFFICIGVIWRIQAALLFVPFIFLEIIIGACAADSRVYYWKNVKKVFVGCWLFFLILVISRFVVQTSEKYTSSVEYDSARVTVQDFPMKDWEEVKNELGGVSENEYNGVKKWILLDTENIDKDFLIRIGQSGATTKFPISVQGIIHALKSMILTIWGSSKIIWILLGVLLSLFLYAFVINMSWWRKLECVLVCIGAVLIILYYTMLGRAPLRVWESVIFAAMEILIVNIAFAEKKDVTIGWQVVLKLFVAFMLCVGIIKDIATAGFCVPQLAINSRSDACEFSDNEIYEEDTLIFWDSWHTNVTNYFMEKGKLPAVDFLNHNLSIGDWIYGQVYFNNHLIEVNASNPAKALLQRNNTYFVGSDYTFLLEYLREHYGINIGVKKCGEINNLPIWKFEKNN